MRVPLMTVVTAALVASAVTGVAWRVAGSPTPWRTTAELDAARPQPPHLPPSETFAEVFAPCAHCHEIGPGARIATAPPLTGVIGRIAGTYPGFPYSTAMKQSDITWDEATIARFIENPQALVPGTRMSLDGLPKERVAAIASYIAKIDRQAQAPARQLAPETLAIGGPFTLVDTKGRTVTEADLRGRPSAIFFGYTNCPDVCPTTLLDLTNLMKDLGADADRLNVVFVSVDPKRDTPSQLADYLSSFDPRIRGFTGTEAQVDAMADAWHVYRKKVPSADGGYSMDHTATVFLMDAGGTFAGSLSFEEDAKTSLAKLRHLLHPKT